MTFDWIAESFAAMAMLINFVAYRQTNINRYRLISGLAMICLGTHFLLLDALAAAIGCYLAFFRNLISMRIQTIDVVVVFVCINLAFFTFELVVLQNSLFILLAYTASIIFTVGTFLISSAHRIRQYFLIAESLNLVYAIIVGSLIGTLGIVVSILGIVSKIWQERRSVSSMQGTL
ncbi:YgjV family protein [Aliiglaciecola sp.]|nr:YgjV family protein [Aliiglaciecola sp.]